MIAILPTNKYNIQRLAFWFYREKKKIGLLEYDMTVFDMVCVNAPNNFCGGK